MLFPGEGFPYEPISDEQKLLVIQHCGGPPVDDPAIVRQFLSIAGTTLVDRYPLRLVLGSYKRTTVKALGLEQPKGLLGFNRGAFLYAGMLMDMTGVDELPIVEQVVRDTVEKLSDDPANMGLEAYQQAADIPSYTDILRLVGPVMLDDEEMYQAARMGAGALHLMVTQSVELVQSQSGLSQAHPELADLETMFGELGNEY